MHTFIKAENIIMIIMHVVGNNNPEQKKARVNVTNRISSVADTLLPLQTT